ncbi:hypothetical protein SMALA_2284 [Streptomyces malaysiensis subsp. malaysiensis]|nr:hypothetical protein SMALA_2284 [Streptomyces malaysiensis]
MLVLRATLGVPRVLSRAYGPKGAKSGPNYSCCGGD